MITGDVKHCIELAVLEELKQELARKHGIEYDPKDIDEFIDQRFDGESIENT